MRIRTYALLLPILLATGGCVATTATMLNPSLSVMGKVDPRTVRIYRSADQIPGKYEEIAILHSTGESNYTNEDMMYESMRQKAASLGANGVLLAGIAEASAGAKVAAAVFRTSTSRKGEAVAIYVYPVGR